MVAGQVNGGHQELINMVEFLNKKNYSKYFFSILGIGIIAMGFLYVWKGGSAFSYVLLFILYMLIFAGQRFTSKIEIGKSIIIIHYYKWFFKRELRLELHNIEAKITTAVANRAGSEYKKLLLSKNQKLLTSINSNDGFDEDDFFKIAELINFNKQVES